MGVDRKGNKKPDTDGSDASKYKKAAQDVKEMTKKEKEEGDDRKKDDKIEAETEKMRFKENARTDAEQEGYKDGFEDAKDDVEGALKKMKVSELKAKIREDIISLLQEEEAEVEEGYNNRDGDKDDSPTEKETEKMRFKEDARTDAEEEGYEDGMEDEKMDLEDEPLDAETAQGGLSDDEREVQDALKLAYDNALAMGDQKLADQIGNSITFFTRTHVVER
jgi:hypothetical protein